MSNEQLSALLKILLVYLETAVIKVETDLPDNLGESHSAGNPFNPEQQVISYPVLDPIHQVMDTMDGLISDLEKK